MLKRHEVETPVHDLPGRRPDIGRPVAEQARLKRPGMRRGQPGGGRERVCAAVEGFTQGPGEPLDGLRDLGDVVVLRDDERDQHFPGILDEEADASCVRENARQDRIPGQRGLNAADACPVRGREAEIAQKGVTGVRGIGRDEAQAPGILGEAHYAAVDDAGGDFPAARVGLPSPPEGLAGVQCPPQMQSLHLGKPRRHAQTSNRSSPSTTNCDHDSSRA